MERKEIFQNLIMQALVQNVTEEGKTSVTEGEVIWFTHGFRTAWLTALQHIQDLEKHNNYDSRISIEQYVRHLRVYAQDIGLTLFDSIFKPENRTPQQVLDIQEGWNEALERAALEIEMAVNNGQDPKSVINELRSIKRQF